MNLGHTSGWRETPLDSLLTALETGSRPRGGVKGILAGVPSIGGEHLNADGGFDLETLRFVPEEFAAKQEKGWVRSSDILVVKDGATTGKCSFVGSAFPHKRALLNEHVFRCAVSQDALPKYIFYWMWSAAGQQQILQDFRGAAQGGISRNFAKGVRVPLAPLRTQEAIVAALDSYFSRLDEVEAGLERVQRNLKRYRASVLQAAVTGRLVPTEAELARAGGREYEPASELLKRILVERRKKWEESGRRGKYEEPAPPDTSNLPELPEGWCWATTAQIGAVSGGLTQNAKRRQLPLTLPFLRVANVYAGELRLDEVEQIGLEESEVERVLLREGDLLVVEGNGSLDQIGRVARWDGSIAPCVHQNHLIKIRFELADLSRWALLWFLSPAGRHHIEAVASSTSGLHTLSLSKVGSLPVPLCPLLEQLRIQQEADRLLAHQTATQGAMEVSLQRSNRLRQSILKSAFEGDLVNHDPKAEPAEALAERAQTERAGAADRMATPKHRGRRSR